MCVILLNVYAYYAYIIIYNDIHKSGSEKLHLPTQAGTPLHNHTDSRRNHTLSIYNRFQYPLTHYILPSHHSNL